MVPGLQRLLCPLPAMGPPSGEGPQEVRPCGQSSGRAMCPTGACFEFKFKFKGSGLAPRAFPRPLGRSFSASSNPCGSQGWNLEFDL